MGLFNKKKEIKANFIKLNEVESFAESTFKETGLYSRYLKIVEELNYHKEKIAQYNEVIISREFDKRIIQDKDYFKKSAQKVNSLIKEFLEEMTPVNSVLKIVEFSENSIELMEEFEQKVSVPLKHLEDVMPKLLDRINLKIKSISDMLAEFIKYSQNEKVQALGKIKRLLNEYYELEDQKNELKNSRIPLLDKLTQVSMMKDRVSARLENLKSKRNMIEVVKLIKERDEKETALLEQSSIIRVNLSYINELIKNKEIKDYFSEIIQSNEILSKEDYEKIKNKLNETEFKNKPKIVTKINSLESKFYELHEEHSLLIRRLRDNMTYMSIKEQEDSFNLWNKKFNELRDKVKEIDEKISDMSLDFIIQKLNKELQKISANTIVE